MSASLRHLGPACAALLLAVACGGTEFTPGSSADGDGAPPAPTADAAPDAPPPACVIPPAATGDEAAFCAAETAIDNRCQPCDACRQTDVNNCLAQGDSLSDAFKQAIVGCTDSIGCGGFSTYATDACVRGKLGGAAPTAAQTTARTQYCSHCLTNTSECNTYFDPPADGGTGGIGFIVLLSSDAIADAVASGCATTAAGCGAVTYYACALAQFCKTQGPDACGSGYCGK